MLLSFDLKPLSIGGPTIEGGPGQIDYLAGYRARYARRGEALVSCFISTPLDAVDHAMIETPSWKGSSAGAPKEASI
jgi:hypothetical protein